MSVVRYTFYLDNAGQAALSATPSFETFIDLDSSVEGSVIAYPVASYPSIFELSGGFYMFEFDWSQVEGNSYLVKINCGDENEFVAPEQRFIIMKLERHDNLHNMVDAIQTSSDNITSSTDELLKFIKRLLEVEKGTWEIDVNTKQLVLYSTNKGSGADSFYETGTPGGTELARYNLQDEQGVANITNPTKRVLVNNTLLQLP